MAKRLLVPVDGSEQSRKALEFACELARGMGYSLHLIHVAQSLPHDRVMVLGGAHVTIHASREDLERAGKDVLDACRKLAAEHGLTEPETEVVAGDPAGRIVEAARRLEADMLVMGSRGLGDLKGLVLGSVSHKVNQLAPCTCITVR